MNCVSIECPFCECHNSLLVISFLKKKSKVCSDCKQEINFYENEGKLAMVFLNEEQKSSDPEMFRSGLKT